MCAYIYILYTNTYTRHTSTRPTLGYGWSVSGECKRSYTAIASACPALLENCSCQVHTHTFGTRLAINESHTRRRGKESERERDTVEMKSEWDRVL